MGCGSWRSRDAGKLAACVSRRGVPLVLGSMVTWWSPDPRAVFDLERYRPSRSLRKRIRRAGWLFTLDRDFEGVMRKCAEPTPSRPTTWITDDFIAAYTDLHRRGAAHSVEVYEKEELVGGLYGVSIGASSEANRCSIAAPMPRRLRSYILCSTCASVVSFCSMARCRRPIWRSWARPRSRVTSSRTTATGYCPSGRVLIVPQGMVGYHAPIMSCGGMPVHSRGEPVGFAGGAPSREGLARPSEASGVGVGVWGRRAEQPFEGSHISGGGRLRGFVGTRCLRQATARPAPTAPVEKLRLKVIRTFPHDPHAFTQGLLFFEGKFYESTGLNGRSSLRGWIRTAAWSSAGSTCQRICLARDWRGSAAACFN